MQFGIQDEDTRDMGYDIHIISNPKVFSKSMCMSCDCDCVSKVSKQASPEPNKKNHL